MIDLRKKRFGSIGRRCWCDMCGIYPGLQLHEIINRGRTLGNEQARQDSFQPEICSILCAKCHEKAHRTDSRKKLLDFNIRLHGANAVIRALKEIPEQFWAGIKINV